MAVELVVVLILALIVIIAFSIFFALLVANVIRTGAPKRNIITFFLLGCLSIIVVITMFVFAIQYRFF